MNKTRIESSVDFKYFTRIYLNLPDIISEETADDYLQISKFMFNIPFEQELGISLHKSETNYGAFKKLLPTSVRI